MKSIYQWRTAALLALAGILGATNALAQSSVPSPIRTRAIINAKVEVGDGKTIERATIVMQDGIITALGKDAVVPAGAEIQDGKGLTVLPGFIDAFNTKAIKFPKLEDKQDDEAPRSDYASAYMREANRKGVHPDICAADFLDISAATLKSYHAAGFTSAMIAPNGTIVSGTASFVLLNGRASRHAVLAPTSAMVMGFNAGPGDDYPDSTLGSVAQLRQVLLDTQWHSAVAATYAAGGARPAPYDLALENLKPVLSGAIPPLFEANSAAEIERGLRIAQEFRLKLLISGGNQAWRVTDRLKKANAGVLVSLAFGKEPESKKSEPDEEPEPLAVAKENRRIWQESVSNLAKLQAAGVPIALTMVGCQDYDEFRTNLELAIKAGFSRAGALQALTASAADLLGVGRFVGRIQPGKLANLCLWDGDFVNSKSKVKMVYVDGRKIDLSRDDSGPEPRLPAKEVE